MSLFSKIDRMRYIAQRLGMLLFTLFLLSLALFALMRLAPGDPAALLLQGMGDIHNEELLAHYQRKWGLDQSFLVQYARWLWQILHGNLGYSYRSERPVTEEIVSRLFPTLSLIVCCFVLTFLVAIPLGIAAALREGSLLDKLVYGGSVLGLSVPIYWLGLMLMLFFGVVWPVLPIVGLETARHYILPVATIAVVEIVYFARMLRSVALEYRDAHYMESAAARGIRRRVLYQKYLFRAMLFPSITLIGGSLPSFLGAAIVIENIFSIPGIGKLMLDTIYSRDYPVIQGCGLLVATAIFVLNFLVEVGYLFADPRILPDNRKGGS